MENRQFEPVLVTRFELDWLRNTVVLLDSLNGGFKDHATTLQNWVEDKTGRKAIPRLDHPDDFDEELLVRAIKNRADRFERLRLADAPEVIVEQERVLLDKVCGEWIIRRGDFKDV